VTEDATFVAGRLEGAGHDRARLAQDQAEQACALGRELGLLRTPEVSWEHFKGASESHHGTEHLVEFDEELARMVKITLPPNLD